MAPGLTWANGISGNLLETLIDFLKDRKQRVVLNGKNSSWANVRAGVSQGSILSPLLFLIYINDLSDNLSTNVKLFADDTSLFSVVQDIVTSACDLNYDLNRVREWVFQWKMSLNPEPSKQAYKVIFTRKLSQVVLEERHGKNLSRTRFRVPSGKTLL